MMDVFIVWMSVFSHGRWIDSIFISATSAYDRVKQLQGSIETAGKIFGPSNHNAWVMEAKIEDAKLVTKRNAA